MSWFRWLGRIGFTMVTGVRHREHPEIPYMNTSSLLMSQMHTRSSIFFISKYRGKKYLAAEPGIF